MYARLKRGNTTKRRRIYVQDVQGVAETVEIDSVKDENDIEMKCSTPGSIRHMTSENLYNI